jgi:hypothetical protein
MSGNGSAFSEYIQGNALAKITPTATNSGPIQTGMQSKSVGGSKKQRRSGRSKKGGASKREYAHGWPHTPHCDLPCGALGRRHRRNCAKRLPVHWQSGRCPG